jgi:hypothetical protein
MMYSTLLYLCQRGYIRHQTTMPTVTTTDEGRHQGRWTYASTNMLQYSVDQNALNKQWTGVTGRCALNHCNHMSASGSFSHVPFDLKLKTCDIHWLNLWSWWDQCFWHHWTLQSMFELSFCRMVASRTEGKSRRADLSLVSVWCLFGLSLVTLWSLSGLSLWSLSLVFLSLALDALCT